jgi:hypothetical protein
VTGSKDSFLLVWPLPDKEMIEKQLKAKIISVDTSLEDSSGVLVHAQMTNRITFFWPATKRRWWSIRERSEQMVAASPGGAVSIGRSGSAIARIRSRPAKYERSSSARSA